MLQVAFALSFLLDFFEELYIREVNFLEFSKIEKVHDDGYRCRKQTPKHFRMHEFHKCGEDNRRTPIQEQEVVKND